MVRFILVDRVIGNLPIIFCCSNTGKHDDLFTNWDSIATSQLTDIWYDLQGVKNLLGHEIPVLTTLYSV